MSACVYAAKPERPLVPEPEGGTQLSPSDSFIFSFANKLVELQAMLELGGQVLCSLCFTVSPLLSPLSTLFPFFFSTSALLPPYSSIFFFFSPQPQSFSFLVFAISFPSLELSGSHLKIQGLTQ